MQDRTFPAVLHRFDRHLDVLGRADSTRRKYRYELLCWWVDYLFPSGLDVADVRSGHVEEYVGALPRHGSKRSDALRALRAFMAWAVVEGELDRNPVAHIPVPRPKIAPAPDLSDEEMRRLLRAAFRRERRRGWAILLCYVTGARVGSLVAARPADVHLGADARLDLLEAKGGKPYSVPLERAGVIAAARLLDICSTSRLIGVGAERFRQWVHAAEQEAGLGRVWPHLLRHAFLTRVAHAKGVSPEEVRKLANWSDLSQWPRYIAASDPVARQAIGAVLGGHAKAPVPTEGRKNGRDGR
jgi:integrase